MIKVVLVEDEEYLRREIALTTAWQDLGCTLMGEAQNGTEGLRLIEKIRPQLVITDIRMPGLDGLAMLEEAGRKLGPEKPWAILLTGHSDFEYARQGLRLGVKDYLLKPIDDDEFYKLLKRIAGELEAGMQRHQASRERDIENKNPLFLFNGECPLPRGDGKDTYIKHSLEYIKKNYPQDISLQTAADSLGITQGYLSRLFKERTGYTFLEYLTYFRLRKAMKLLQVSSLKINEIAHQTGYPDHAYFSQLFRRHMGMTPGQFQNGNFHIRQ